jgi:hypothetical protein
MAAMEPEETVKRLISEVVQNPDRYPDEAKLILILELRRRKSGCGWVYLYGEEVATLLGKVDYVTLEWSERDCEVHEKLAVIPKKVPSVVIVAKWDEDPEARHYVTLYVFTNQGWKSISTEVVDARKLLAELADHETDRE